MFLATSNQAKQLLCLTYASRVSPEELQRGHEDVRVLLAGLSPGFRLLVDLSQVESIDLDCAPEIGRLMDMTDQAGVGLVVRVIPDPDKDIGMNILAVFHYPHHPRIVTCDNLTEAMRALWL